MRETREKVEKKKRESLAGCTHTHTHTSSFNEQIKNESRYNFGGFSSYHYCINIACGSKYKLSNW